MKLTILGGGGFRVPLVYKALLADEAARFTTILDSLAVDVDATDRLEAAAAGLRDGARSAFDDLTAPELD